MRHFSFAAAFLLTSFLLSVPPAGADPVDDYLRAQMAERRIPGIALTVIQGGKTVKTATYGLADLEHQVLVRPETVFEIGSVTKQFTAAGILLLQQEGKLSVDDKIQKHLAATPTAWTNITIRHLLTHTSGIKSYTGLTGFELTRRLTQSQFIATFQAHPLEFAPGESWRYSNTGYSLLGYIIENASGETYWNYLRRKIFTPLQMTNTTDRFPTTLISHRARGYEQTNGVWINRDYDLTDVFAAGAMVSTVGDLAKWHAALDGDKLLSAPSKQAMWSISVQPTQRASKYGLGWYIDEVEGRRNFGHGGSTSGFSASYQRFPDDELGVIILSNTDQQIATTLARKIATFYFRKN
jgi:CubicO group peptidase (beta-lactamase class C family)